MSRVASPELIRLAEAVSKPTYETFLRTDALIGARFVKTPDD